MTTSNADEVNRLLAESDSSSGDDNDEISGLVGAGREAFMDNLLSSKSTVATDGKSVKPSTSNPVARSYSITKKSSGQSMAVLNSNRMNAQDILNAVSSDSDEDDAEVVKMMQERLMQSGTEERKASAGGADYDFYLKNMNDPAVREKFLQQALDMSSSDEDEDQAISSPTNKKQQVFRPSSTTNKAGKGRSESMFKVQQNLGPVALVEINERQSQHTPEKIMEEASQLLSFDKEFYNVKKELFQYSHFQQISKSLYEETAHQYYGLVSCIRMFRAKNGTVVFVGNSAGYIRVFDIQTQRQMKPLYDDTLFQNKVLCIDISEDGHYLLAGYKNGTLVLWDSAKYKKAHVMNDVSKNAQSEFSMVKLLYTTEQNVVVIVTAEESGRIRLVHITKTFLGGFSHKANSLYESDLKGCASISVQRPSNLPSHYSPFCDASCLTAFGATNMVTIVEMKQFPPRPLKTINRPAVCKEKSVPAVDWGYGLTPYERTRTLPLMVIAWDKIVQLCYINDETKKIEFDGYYCSDKEINQVYFMADSVLVILLNGEEIKVLYTEKFQPGDVNQLDTKQPGQDIIVSREFKATVEGTKASELEVGHLVKDIKPGLVTYHVDRPDGTKVERKVLNFNNTICQYKKNIIFIGSSKIYRARLLSWREFIDKLKFTDNHDWLTVLKVALEIYNGEIKGFALLPDYKERRQSFLKDYMKKLILTSIQTVIFKFKTSNHDSDSTHNDSDDVNSSNEEKDFSIDKIAIKVSIEFCLQISEVDYLFGDIYRFFVEKELEDKFIAHLCAPIIAGQFRNEYIPEHVLQKLVRMYEDRQEFKILEKLILNINIEAYQKRMASSDHLSASSQTKGIRAYLEVVCKSHCMVSALLQLQTSDKLKHVREGCTQILHMLLNNMETQKAVAEQDQIMRSNTSAADKVHRRVTKQDMQLLRNADKNRKYEIEQSSFYIGYKLLWILGLFLKGKKFPQGDLIESQFKAHVLNIVDFVTDEQTLALLLDFDSEAFFQTVIFLFSDKPWHYLINCSKSQVFEFQKQEHENPYKPCEPQENDENTSLTAQATKILLIFKQAADRTNRKDPDFTKACFLELILCIIVAQDKQQRNQNLTTNTPIIKLKMDYNWIVAALKSVLSGKHNALPSLVETVISDGQDLVGLSEAKQQLIIDVLKAVEIQSSHIDEVIALIQPNQQNNLTRVKIQLFEAKHDYVEAFMLHLNNDVLKKQLFKWLFETMDKLTKRDTQIRRGTVKSSNQMAFSGKGQRKQGAATQLTDAEKLLDDGSDSDEEGKARNSSNSASGSKADDQYEEYEPLMRLKRTLKGRIAELAKQNSEQTVKLVETYLSDGDFQDKLIMEELFKDEQLNYLTSYITKNEETIKQALSNEDVFFSESQNQTARKYEKYLILFTKLLCRLQGHLVDQWVCKSYFPPDQCLPICREYQNLRGQAILTMRSGLPIDAIDVYLNILTSYPIHKMISQFKLLYKDRPSFLDFIDLSEGELNQQEIEQDKKGKEGSKQHTYFVPDSIIEFDSVLGKACNICQLDDLDSEQRMGAWFKILRYLQNFMVESFNKVSEGLINAKKEHKENLGLTGIKEDDKPLYIKRLKDFIMDRINYILRFPGLDIPLKMIVEQLNLTFEQIQQLCASKLRHNGTTLRIEQCQQMITVRQLCDMFEETSEKLSSGFLVEPNKRLAPNPRPGGRRLIKAHTICNACMSSIVRNAKMAEPIVIFQCNHQYHSACLSEKQREIGTKKCPICIKQNYMAIREERDKIELRQRKRTGRRPGRTSSVSTAQADATDDESENGGPQHSNADSRDGYSGDFDQNKIKHNQVEGFSVSTIRMRKLEQFDDMLGDVSLALSEFEEAMAK